MATDELMITRYPLSLPGKYTPVQLAMIAAAIAEATADPTSLVDRSGTLCRDPRGLHFAIFEPLAYQLSSERCVAPEGSVWDTVPVLAPGIVGCWQPDEAGRLLHLVRDVSRGGELAFGAGWEPVWIAAPWCRPSELDLAQAISREATRYAPQFA